MEKIINCPACASHMDKVKVSNVVLDICQKGCGGIWFDKNELEHFDEAHESDKLLNINTALKEVDDKFDRICPVCTGVQMSKIDFASLNKFQIDVCPSCGGSFLDKKELDKLRANTEFLASNFKMSDTKLKCSDNIIMVLSRKLYDFLYE